MKSQHSHTSHTKTLDFNQYWVAVEVAYSINSIAMNTKPTTTNNSDFPEQLAIESGTTVSGLISASSSEDNSPIDNAHLEDHNASLDNTAQDTLSSSVIDAAVDTSSDASEKQIDGEPDSVQSDSPDKSEESSDAEEQIIVQSETNTEKEDKRNTTDAEDLVVQTEKLYEALKMALEDGQLRECISLYEKAQAKIKRLADLNYDSKRLNKINKRINSIHAQVRELKDWRHWGIQQSRLDFITKLEKLADYEGNPLQLYSQLKELRETWNSWIKAGDFPNRAMRERFSNAYEEAFKPCKAYFKQQKKQRKANKKLRKQICQQLDEFFEETDWSQPDWSAVTATIRSARKQWKNAVPLNKKDWNSTNAKLDEIIGKFDSHLERERQRGVLFRLQLIEIAESLDSEPVKVATDKVKQLQQDWKTVNVRDKKKKEKELWDKFHIACDRQFQRRAEIRKSFEGKQRESTQTKKALLGEIRRINRLPIDQIKIHASELSTIQNKWAGASATGGKSRSSLDNEFKREVAKFRQTIRKLNKIEIEAALAVLESKAKLCDEIELHAIRGTNKADVHSYRNRWASIEDQCGEFEEAIRNRFESACAMFDDSDTSNSNQWQQNLQAKQDICLKLEILSKIDSPPEFAQDRMQTNIARLKSAMVDHSATADPEIETRDLLVNYWLTGAVPEQAHESLNNRFNRIREELSKSS